MTTMKPTPTEYKGTVFRSKSEAMFARFIDVCPLDRRWIYEPAFLEVNNYTPDFLCWGWGKDSRTGNRHIVAEVIEYKPSMPTCAYLERIGSMFSDISAKATDFFDGVTSSINLPRVAELIGANKPPMLAFDVYVGSVWTERCRFRMTKHAHDFYKSDFDWLASYADEIKSYRFDLQH